MVWESIVFMLWASLGTLQIIASHAHLKGISLFNRGNLGYIFGTLNVIASFYWFFSTVEISEGGPKGQHDDQFLSFVIGIGSAILITWILSSVVKFKWQRKGINSDNDSCGIEVFRERTFFQVVSKRLSDRRRGRNAP